jgi:tetratricopeptide (TPR) repeat protein
MLPAMAMVWAWWWSAHGRRGRAPRGHGGGAWRRADALLGFALPLATLAVMAPRIVATSTGTDAAVHFTPATVREQGGVWRAAFAGTRPWDMASLALLLSPLAIAVPGLAAALGRMPGRGREIAALALLALPFAAILPLIHPVHGLHRDWDDFAATGVALSLVTAWLVGETLRGATRRAWVGVAVALGVAMPAFQWLFAHVETTRGIARVRAFVTEPPLRSPPERGHTWDYIGIRSYRLERYAEAQAAFARAVETSPSPRILQEWAVAATYAGDLHAAQNAWRRVLEKNPGDAMAWMGLAAISMRLRDVPEAKRAALGLERVIPGHESARRILADIARYEQLQADSLRRARGE